MSTRVLIAEDDLATSELVRLYLAQEGHHVMAAADGLEALRLAQGERPDLIVLDLMLPGMDGLEICRHLRQDSDVPIIMLTARVDEEDRLSGLDVGADDYVTKPFSPRELAARVRAVLRRAARERLEGQGGELKFDDVRLDLSQHAAYVCGRRVSLTRTEFRLLATLVREPHRTFSRDHIIQRVFGDDFDGYDRTVDAHASSLRRKLNATAPGRGYIQAVYGVGYRFSDV